MRRLGGLLAILVCATMSACGSSSPSAQSQTPSELRAAILAAVRGQHSLHYVDAETAHGLRQKVVGDIAADRGIQRTSFRLFSKPGHFTILVVDHTVYLRGDAAAFSYFGFPMQAVKYAGRWVVIRRKGGGGFYARFAADVTLGSFFSDHTPRHDLSLVRNGLRGRAALPAATAPTGSVPVELWVYVRSPTRPLPVEARTQDLTTTFKARTTLGPWNEPVRVTAPANAVPFLRLLVRG